MGAAASLEPHALDVDPGGVATCTVTVRNTGSVVDELSFSVLGPAGAWADVQPPSISLFPGAEGTATVRFRPPRDASTRSGRIPFGLRVASREDPAGSVVEEGALTVSSYGANTAELLPRTARGRRGARYEVAVDNRGNSEGTIRFAPTDPAEALSFQLVPPEVVVPPGSASFVKLRVRSKSFMRGQPKTRPFAVAVQPEGDAPIALDGTFLQEALLPRWLLPLLLGLVALALIWFFLLKPEIKSQARDAVAQPIANANKKAANAQQAAQAAASKADTAAAAAAGKTPPKTTPTTTPPPVKKPTKKPAATTSTANALGSPLLGRMATQCPPTCTAELKAAPKQTLSIADLILQNPEGDSGTLQISIRGTPELLFRLDNFRDYDYHFVASPTLKPGDSMTITVVCQNKGKKACTAAVFWSGFGKRGKG
jgi:hypothetical protein